MTKLRIKLIKSLIGTPRKHREIVKCLGLGRLNSSVELDDIPSVRGAVNKVYYLVKVEEI